MKKYSVAPLPFKGQKRIFIKEFNKIINTEFKNENLFVELFGGSGLLSHNIKKNLPHAKVIYNDYDNYVKRLNSIDLTNEILNKLKKIVDNYKLKYKEKISPAIKNEILQIIEFYREQDIDYITLSTNLIFWNKLSVNNYHDFKSPPFYNNIRTNDYNKDGYLDGLIITKNDYLELIEKYKNKGAVFIIDPPYLNTDTISYKGKDDKELTKNVLKICAEQNKFIHFSSSKENLQQFFNDDFQPFAGCTTIEKQGTFL